MNTSRNFKIIVIGCAAISLTIALKIITYESNHSQNTSRMEVDGMLAENTAIRKISSPHTNIRTLGGSDMQKVPSETQQAEPQTVTVSYDLRSEREAELIYNMNYALTNSATPIVADERTLRKLVMARIKGDWSTVPKGPDWADAPEWQRHSADMLKRNIGYLLPSGTTNVVVETDEGMQTNTVVIPATPETIERVIKADVGTTVPPMEDYEVHD